MGQNESNAMNIDDTTMSKQTNVNTFIQSLQKEIDRLDKQIDLKKKEIIELGNTGQKKRAVDETEKLRGLMNDRERKNGTMRQLSRGQRQLNVAEDLMETQQYMKQMTAEKTRLASMINPVDMREIDMDSRLADRELEQSLQYAGLTNENYETENQLNEDLFAELMRDTSSNKVTTTTTTTTTTKTQQFDHDIMRF
jgi:hypothetical protein